MHEIKNAIRSLLRTPAHSGVIILTLGLGIGATTFGERRLSPALRLLWGSA